MHSLTNEIHFADLQLRVKFRKLTGQWTIQRKRKWFWKYNKTYPVFDSQFAASTWLIHNYKKFK